MIRVRKIEGSLVEADVEGRITHEDYQEILPKLEQVIEEHGRLDCLIEMKEIGWIETRAIIDDLKFDVRHAGDFGRIALITDRRWHEWVMKLWGTLLPKVKVKCFGRDERKAAGEWVRG